MTKENQSDSAKSADSKNEQQLKITVPQEVAKGQYSNLMINNFSQEEFILDFALVQPHVASASVNSRIILTPRNAKKLMVMLSQHIKEYESKLGPITEENNTPSIGLSFN